MTESNEFVAVIIEFKFKILNEISQFLEDFV